MFSLLRHFVLQHLLLQLSGSPEFFKRPKLLKKINTHHKVNMNNPTNNDSEEALIYSCANTCKYGFGVTSSWTHTHNSTTTE